MTAKAYIFDYGGTLDTNGCHWGRFVWHAYRHQHVPVNWEQFREAYVYAERQLGKYPIIQSSYGFRQTLSVKLRIEMEYLVSQGYWYSAPLEQERLHAAVLENLYALVVEQTARSREVLCQLRGQAPLVLCSNYYGNLAEVLRELHLDNLFEAVVESAVVGIRKPDRRIYQLALDRLEGVDAADVAVVGDSVKNDILPALQLGCRAVWLQGEPWDADSLHTETLAATAVHLAPEVIKDIAELVK